MDLAQRIAQLSPEQRKLLEKKLAQQDIDILKIPVTRETEEKGYKYPLSFGQERLWFIQQLEPGNSAYNLMRAVKLEGEFDPDALIRSINTIVARHDILRATFQFENEKPFQVISDFSPITMEITDLNHIIAEDKEKQVQMHIDEDLKKPFDLVTGPLLRTRLFILNRNQYVFLLVIHHIVSDGTSIQVFIRELVRHYQAYRAYGNKPAETASIVMPPLTIQYEDYACWQRRWFGTELESVTRKKQEAFWLDQFKGEIPMLDLPFDFERPPLQDFEGDSIDFHLDLRESDAIRKLASTEKTTLYVVLLSILDIMLSRLSGVEDIIIGTPVAGRRHPDVHQLIGMFVNTLALRNYPRTDLSFLEFLRDVRERTLNAFENQEYRYEDIVNRVNVARDTGRNPLFDVMFLFRNVDYAEVNIPGLLMKTFEIENKTSKFDLTLSAWESNHILHFNFEYCAKLFKRETIDRFIGYYVQTLRSIIDNERMTLRDIDIIPESEKVLLLYGFNKTEVPYDTDKTLHGIIEEQALRNPDRIGITGKLLTEERKTGTEILHLTYRELNERAEMLSNRLREVGVKRGDLVAVFADRTAQLMVGLLAVLKGGGVYVPLDPQHPSKRIKYILESANAGVVLTDNDILDDSGLITIQLGDENNYVREISSSSLRVSSGEGAYTIFTSGTTGLPKGVMIEHRAVINFIEGMNRIIEFGINNVILSLTTVSFDIFGLETYVPLASGSRVIMGTTDEQLDPSLSLQAMQRESVDIFQLTPSRLQLLLSSSDPLLNNALARLRFLLVGGEAFPERLLEQVKPLMNGTILNVYGPTETTIWSTAKNLSKETPLNIGRPIANTQIYILDKYMRLTPVNIMGDIYIAGDGLARGYLNKPELTAEKFISFSLRENRLTLNNLDKDASKGESSQSHSGLNTITVYKTGDIGKWRSDGTIDFFGRSDHQVKIRGYRIELEEIENRMRHFDKIKEAVAVTRNDTSGNPFICAYYILKDTAEKVDNSILREFLAGELPEYMIPSYFIQIESIPLTPNKKIDRKALPDPDGFRPQVGSSYLAPQTELEEKLVRHWMNVLHMDKIGVHDNFFELGGNSMKIIQLNKVLKTDLGKDIPVAVMFKHLTISSFARYLVELERNETSLAAQKSNEQKKQSMNNAKNLFRSTIVKTATKGRFDRV